MKTKYTISLLSLLTVAFATLDGLLVVHAKTQRAAFEQLHSAYSPRTGDSVIVLSGTAPLRGLTSQPEPITISTGPGAAPTIIMTVQAKCRPCQEALPSLQTLAEVARRANPDVRIVVLDRYGIGSFDAIDDDVRPDVRMRPTAETLLAHKLLESPLVMLVKDGVCRMVVHGKVSTADLNGIAELLKVKPR